MNAKKAATAAGFKNLSEVSRLSTVSLTTLGNWARHKPQLFETVLLGCAVQLSKEEFEKLYSEHMEEDLHPSSRESDIEGLYEHYKGVAEQDGYLVTRTVFTAAADELVAELASGAQ